ncbi:low temperature requirement protein A (plasmid) [Streptomyces sp. BI20]|uniref:low temperature requirement protein A n=1 Tax=Streptomyces sp. BI20 TaxID=3403460 RepID=UPI003C7418AF
MTDAQRGEGSPDTGTGTGTAVEERHATWLELFFDLIAVVGTAQLAHLLHGDPSAADIGLFVLLYLAFWTVWMCFTVYGNVAGDRARERTLLVGMLGMAVLAASVAGVHEGEHERAFALTYVLLRFVASGVWRRRREMLVDWPVAQFTAGVTPWVVSIWVDGPARHWLWAAGLAIDLWATLGISAARIRESVTARLSAPPRGGGPRTGGRGPRTGRGAHDTREAPGARVARDAREARDRLPLTFAHVDPVHLGERLGLFTIIVLGEGVAQLVTTGSGEGWDRPLWGFGLAAFLLLVALWRLSLVRGYGGVPTLGAGVLPPRLVLLAHCVVNGALTALAAGLGAAMAHRHGPLPDHVRWTLCASLAVYVAVAVLAAVVTRRARGGPRDRRGLFGHLLPALLVSPAVGLFGGGLSALAVVWLLLLGPAWGVAGYLGRPARQAPEMPKVPEVPDART